MRLNGLGGPFGFETGFLVSSDLELEKAKWPMEPERATVKIIEEKPFVHGVHGDRKGSPLLYFGFARRSNQR